MGIINPLGDDVNAQITSPIEGQFCYLADTNVLQFYNGSAWTNFIGEGTDPTEVFEFLCQISNWGLHKTGSSPNGGKVWPTGGKKKRQHGFMLFER